MRAKDWLIAGGIVLCCTVVLVACGGGSDGGGGGDEEAAREDARIEFAECMREHGVDMPDPQPGAMELRIGGPDSDIEPGPVTERALAECEQELPNLAADMSEEEKREFEEQALAFAQCMRENGVDMPDPQFEGDGKVKMTIGPGSGIDPNSPAFQQAQEACEGELPELRKSGP